MCVGIASSQASQPVPDGLIPHASVVEGTGDIAAAWLAEPTDDYPHGVLGDDLEGGALAVRLRDGTTHIFRLDDGSVFEDLTPRLADIDGDGRDEVWTVRSDSRHGARLEAYAMVDGALRRRYATAPIGIGFRWLNPLGIGDIDGDGSAEAVYVRTPHIGGVLTVVRPMGDRLEPVALARGYSTHAMGSTQLDLGVLADVDGDGALDIILPRQSRRQIVVMSFIDSRLIERWVSPVFGGIRGGLRVVSNGDTHRIEFLGTDGSIESFRISPGALRTN